MYRKNKAFISFLVLLIVFIQIITPQTSLAEVKGNTEVTSTPPQLYKANQDVDLEGGITLIEGAYFYAEKVEEELFVQYNDTETIIPLNNAIEIDPNDEITVTYENIPEESIELRTFSEDTSIYSLYSNEEGIATIKATTSYPVFEDSFGIEVIYIGNVSFYLSKEDRNMAEKKLSDSQDSETTNDIPAEEESSSNGQGQIKEEDGASVGEDTVDETESTKNKEDETEDTEISKEEEPKETDVIEEEQENTLEEPEDNTEQEIERSSEQNLMRSFAVAQDPWEGSSAKYFEVTKDDLIVYDNRGSSLKAVGTLKKGQVYPRVRDYGNWHRIQYGEIYGYVKKEYTIPASGELINNENKEYTNQSRSFTTIGNVTVYDNTSGSLVPFGVINKDSEYPIATDYGNWWRIVYSDRVGYVRKNEVEIQFTNQDKYFRADTNVAVYDNRDGGSLKKVGELIKGQVYPRVSDYGNWHRIQFGSYYGYVRKSDTSFATGDEIKNLNINYKNSSRNFTAINTITVYDNSSGSLQPFGEIDKGAQFAIADDYGNWWRVIYADRVGFVKKDEVKATFQEGDNYFRVINQNLAVYDNRGDSLIKVGELKKGEAYPIKRDYGNWWRVQFGDIYGYVRKSGTSYATKREINNLNYEYTNSTEKLIPEQNVIVYNNSGSGSLIPFGEIEEGTIFPIASDYGNWWRIIYLDRVGYVRKSEVELYGIDHTSYNITLEDAVSKQMQVNPQTDQYDGKVYVHWSAFDSINLNNMTGRISSGFNVRTGPSTGYHPLYVTKNSMNVVLANKDFKRDSNGAKWWEITRSSLPMWINAPSQSVEYYMNPDNFVNDERQQFQFLDLSRNSAAGAADLNRILAGKGILQGMGSSFIEAGNRHNVNDVYLVSHALLETGNGYSELATGIKYNGVTVYNMYGIGAYDNCAVTCGARKAYEEGWTTPEKAIIGGASFIGEDYVNAGQNTLYKMRWYPEKLVTGNPTHQYATDIGWASKQTRNMYNLYQQLQNYTLYLDIPDYK